MATFSRYDAMMWLVPDGWQIAALEARFLSIDFNFWRDQASGSASCRLAVQSDGNMKPMMFFLAFLAVFYDRVENVMVSQIQKDCGLTWFIVELY